MIEVVIDQEECTRCGACTALCVEVFELDDEGRAAQITSKYRGGDKSTGEVPEDVDCVEIAVRKCPLEAIKIVE